jgi:hypothetical protein
MTVSIKREVAGGTCTPMGSVLAYGTEIVIASRPQDVALFVELP